MDTLALWVTHLIFVVVFLTGLAMVFSGQKKNKCPAELWIENFFGWGFIVINGIRWALFVL